jgi:phospholipase C
LILRLSNKGSATCHLVVRANRYSNAAARTYTLVAGAIVDDAWMIASSGHWYALAVSSDSDAGWVRRIAGHMETGYASVSDPAIGAA